MGDDNMIKTVCCDGASASCNGNIETWCCTMHNVSA
jgi:hypothetical protein